MMKMNSVGSAGRFKSIINAVTNAAPSLQRGSARNARIAKKKSAAGLLLLGMLASSLLLLSSFSTNFALAATTTGNNDSNNRDAFQLAVTPIAPKLPADGGSYLIMVQLQTSKDGIPREAPYDVNVTLLTSDNTVASLQDKVTIKSGESLSTATLTSTSKAGKVEITAISQGIASGSASLETINLGSLEPTKLAVYSGSSSLVPNPSLPGKMYVQLLNSGDIPAVTNSALTVYLSSGDSKVGTVPKYVIIPAGASGVGFNFSPTSLSGKTDVTASANGLSPAKVSVETKGLAPTRLAIELAPPTMPSPVGYYSDFIVQLRDDSGFPVLAKQSISVALFSSDTSIATIRDYAVTIEAGNSYAAGKVYSNGKVGSAVISASASGLTSGSATVSTVEHSEASNSSPKAINVYVLPTKIVPNNNEKAAIVVQVTDTAGNIYSHKSYLYIPIILSSSNPGIGSITDGGNLVGEIHYAKAMFKSSFQSGETTISALSSGYSSGMAVVSATGSSPFSLAATQMPRVVLANGQYTGSLVVSLLDENGRPTTAQQDLLLSLSSSNPEIASVEPTEFIPTGKSYGQVELHTTAKAGKTVITAQAPGLAPSSVDFKTVGLTGDSSQYKLGLATIPKLPADVRTYDALFVQLQNSNGNPVPAESDISVVLSSSTNAVTPAKEVTIKKGSSYVVGELTMTGTSPSKPKITASSTGFETVSADLETTVQPLTITPSAALPSRGDLGSIPVAADVFSGKFPIANATVMVGGLAANTTTSTTDENGHAESTYVPTMPGRNSITFTVAKPGYQQGTFSSTILLDQTVTFNVGAKTQAGQPVQLQAKVSGPGGTKTLDVKPSSGASMADVKWGTYRITVPAEINASGAKYKFAGWSDGNDAATAGNSRTVDVIGDRKFTAIYSAQYLLTVASEKGTVSGGGYYEEGKTATISISSVTAGNLLIGSSFNGWTGDIRSATQTADVVMDGPKTVKAEWADSYVLVFVLVGAAGAGGFVAYLKVIKPKMVAKAKARTPDLDWYKS